jgi:hypothetical protein
MMRCGIIRHIPPILDMQDARWRVVKTLAVPV